MAAEKERFRFNLSVLRMLRYCAADGMYLSDYMLAEPESKASVDEGDEGIPRTFSSMAEAFGGEERSSALLSKRSSLGYAPLNDAPERLDQVCLPRRYARAARASAA